MKVTGALYVKSRSTRITNVYEDLKGNAQTHSGLLDHAKHSLKAMYVQIKMKILKLHMATCAKTNMFFELSTDIWF